MLAAWSTGFEPVGWGTLGLLGALTALSVMIDFLAAALGAKRLGASQWAFWGATLGAIVGMFFGLPGILLGPFVGAVAAELAAGHGTHQASRSGYGVWVGAVVGTAAKLAIAFLMLGVFLAKYMFRPDPLRAASDQPTSRYVTRRRVLPAEPPAAPCPRPMLPASGRRTGTIDHQAATPGSRTRRVVSTGHCPWLVRIPGSLP